MTLREPQLLSGWGEPIFVVLAPWFPRGRVKMGTGSPIPTSSWAFFRVLSWAAYVWCKIFKVGNSFGPFWLKTDKIWAPTAGHKVVLTSIILDQLLTIDPSWGLILPIYWWPAGDSPLWDVQNAFYANALFPSITTSAIRDRLAHS